MSKREFKFSTKVSEEEAYLVWTKNLGTMLTDFLEFQVNWSYNAYQRFKDIDKYLILCYFMRRTLQRYSESMVKKSFDDFYSSDSFEIEKFNVIQISKELFISKETARRKVLELENDGVISKNKKAISLNQKAMDIQKPKNSVYNLSRVLANFTSKLIQYKFMRQEFSTYQIEDIMKKNFTLCWLFFLDFQIPYWIRWKKVFEGDIESFIIFGMLAYNQHCNIKKTMISDTDNEFHKYEYVKKMSNEGSFKGLNAMSISDMTGIPRPTVLRKLKNLMKKHKFINKDENNFYLITDFVSKSMNDARLETYKDFTKMSVKIFNLMDV